MGVRSDLDRLYAKRHKTHMESPRSAQGLKEGIVKVHSRNILAFVPAVKGAGGASANYYTPLVWVEWGVYCFQMEHKLLNALRAL